MKCSPVCGKGGQPKVVVRTQGEDSTLLYSGGDVIASLIFVSVLDSNMRHFQKTNKKTTFNLKLLGKLLALGGGGGSKKEKRERKLQTPFS